MPVAPSRLPRASQPVSTGVSDYGKTGNGVAEHPRFDSSLVTHRGFFFTFERGAAWPRHRGDVP
jgi:hypothetical protein